MSQQTAVELFFRWINDNPEATHKEFVKAFEQIKEIEKMQMIRFAYDYSAQTVNEIYTPEEYYNKTYNK